MTLPPKPGRSPNEPTTEGGAGEPKSRTDKPTAGSGAKRRPCGRAQASTQGETRRRRREGERGRMGRAKRVPLPCIVTLIKTSCATYDEVEEGGCCPRGAFERSDCDARTTAPRYNKRA